MSDLDWTNGEWINGPKLAAWLKERDRLPTPNGGDCDKGTEIDWLRRRINYWASGEQASLAAADRWLTFLGCHISELPDHFWEPNRKRGVSTTTRAQRHRVVAWMKEHGASRAATAQEFGLHPRTVLRWEDWQREESAT